MSDHPSARLAHPSAESATVRATVDVTVEVEFQVPLVNGRLGETPERIARRIQDAAAPTRTGARSEVLAMSYEVTES